MIVDVEPRSRSWSGGPTERRAVLLFASSAREEARCKRLRGASLLFELGRDRVLRAVRALDRVTLVVAGESADGVCLPDGALRLPQRGSGFGERLRNAFDDTRALGFTVIVAVGADAPTLCSAHLAGVFAALESATTALGPAEDGGAWAIGVRGDAGALFEGVRWQTPFVLADLQRNAPGAAVLAAVLTDLDDSTGLRELRYRLVDRELGRLVAAVLAVARRGHAPSRLGTAERRAAVSQDPSRGPPAITVAR